MSVNQSVNAHYGRAGLGEIILNALRAAGKAADTLTPNDLAPVDQFHTRGRDATLDLLRLASFGAGMRVLDVGGGIGGPARTLASVADCHVTVLDVTEEFCRVGEMLTDRTGLGDRVTFRHGSALDMPFPDASFDGVWTQHSSMNIEDKKRLYDEVFRVLRPGGRLALYEIMAGEAQPIHFPVPWAREPAISFLRRPNDVRALLTATGFEERTWLDVTAPALEFFDRLQARAAPPPVGPHQPSLGVLMGSEFAQMAANQVRNIREGRIAIIQAVFDRP